MNKKHIWVFYGLLWLLILLVLLIARPITFEFTMVEKPDKFVCECNCNIIDKTRDSFNYTINNDFVDRWNLTYYNFSRLWELKREKE